MDSCTHLNPDGILNPTVCHRIVHTASFSAAERAVPIIPCRRKLDPARFAEGYQHSLCARAGQSTSLEEGRDGRVCQSAVTTQERYGQIIPNPQDLANRPRLDRRLFVEGFLQSQRAKRAQADLPAPAVSLPRSATSGTAPPRVPDEPHVVTSLVLDLITDPRTDAGDGHNLPEPPANWMALPNETDAGDGHNLPEPPANWMALPNENLGRRL
eukprot:TRINITY_DN8929_c0_g1_i1.p1 TRINITY_DN8929_c0_g1~~TRINITY_DN8929_c0_g1_i1.p1  ORF type:complete len:230 (-),score=36.62 TRINITY_DN8929_c0_g1_i1:231-869(-)